MNHTCSLFSRLASLSRLLQYVNTYGWRRAPLHRPRRSLPLAFCPPTARVAIGALRLPIVGKHGAPGWQHHRHKFNTNLLFQLMKTGCQALAAMHQCNASADVLRSANLHSHANGPLTETTWSFLKRLLFTPSVHAPAWFTLGFGMLCAGGRRQHTLERRKMTSSLAYRPYCLSSRAYHPQGHSGGASWPGPAPWE